MIALGVPELVVAEWFLVVLPLVSVILYSVTRPFADRVPVGARTVRSLVRSLAKAEYATGQVDERRQFQRATIWQRRSYADVACQVRKVVAQVVGVNVEQIVDDARFIEDLGC
jgi:hypothetical protein